MTFSFEDKDAIKLILYHHHEDCAYTNAGNTVCTAANPTAAVSFDTMGFGTAEFYLCANSIVLGAAVSGIAALFF